MEQKNGAKNVSLIIGIVVVALVIIVAGSVLIFGKGEERKENNPVSITPSVQTQEQISAITITALNNRDSEMCKTIQKEDAQQYCLTNVLITKASDKKDPKMCDQVADNYSRIVCKDNIIIVKAREVKDPSMCETMVDKTRVAECKRVAK